MKTGILKNVVEIAATVALALAALTPAAAVADNKNSSLELRIAAVEETILKEFGVAFAYRGSLLQDSDGNNYKGLSPDAYLNAIEDFLKEARREDFSPLTPVRDVAVFGPVLTGGLWERYVSKIEPADPATVPNTNYIVNQGPVPSRDLIVYLWGNDRRLDAIYEAIHDKYNWLTDKGVLICSEEFLKRSTEERDSDNKYLGRLTLEEIKKRVPPQLAKRFLQGLINLAGRVEGKDEKRTRINICSSKETETDFAYNYWDGWKQDLVQTDEDNLESVIFEYQFQELIRFIVELPARPIPVDSNTNRSTSGQTVAPMKGNPEAPRARH